ncbi:ESPR domain-containing protein [Alkanindiges sp. WGS2144]|uniref:ESPR domain-containing protein n=1 Tax=Alkanindiges sp. WGS2144 TaxID=3366808 RepID=UPI0037522387
MNHVFKKVWSKTLGRMVVTSELAKNAVEGSSSNVKKAGQDNKELFDINLLGDKLNSTQLNSTQLNSTQLNSTQLNSTQLNSTQLNSKL